MLRKLPAAAAIVVALLFILTAVAFAQDPGAVADPGSVTVGVVLAWAISSVVIPYITAWAAAHDSPPVVASVISGVLAGLVAIGAYFADVDGIPDWKHALGLFVSIGVGAVVYRNWLEPTGATERGTPTSLYDRGVQIGSAAPRR